ncbi:uncharacterized protein BDZ99DRAFT_515494 [Mytilinidion resinicola]|uniref:F-box domain-containing protein n=1 Tax=Mytilinidion resinicola TaxID=574789 RepID=A0A6A6Z0M9_9PEZI|nr:uncharacterized protein BDZ99DRAFT_515494 [Mytilinidion resinicola]KAF2814716.1 hypothetical protein BDZ99DRAFT_515494 [Mytilinidion resinicola]
MKSSPLLALPPELLVNILSFLPITSLLKFSETSHASHALATSSLHTLSLSIHTTRIGGIMSRLGATTLPTPKNTASAFASARNALSASFTESIPRSSRSSQSSLGIAEDSILRSGPHAVHVLIPNAHTFDPSTLLAFHNALISSVLTRHKTTLRHLDLSLWSLTPHIAHALKSLPALRTLSLRIEDPNARSTSRRIRLAHRLEECVAWDILAEDASWASALQALRIDGAQVSTAQLGKLLSCNHLCRELWVCKCHNVDRDVWRYLGSEWKGRTGLQVLGVLKSYVDIEEEDLEFIGGMEGLKFLSLQGCNGPDNDVFEERNRDVWHIPELIPPQPSSRGSTVPAVIEVDPTYQRGVNIE